MAQNLTFNLGVDTNSAVSSINQFFEAFDKGSAQAQSKLNSAFGGKVTTEVEIVLKNGELVAKKIRGSKDETNKLKKVYQALNGELGKTPGKLKEQQKLLRSLRDSTQKFKNDTTKVTNEWKTVTARLREVDRALRTMESGGGMTGFLSKLALVQTAANLATSAIMGLARSGTEFAATAGRMEVLQLQLEAFTGGAQQAQDVFNDFVQIAANTPFNLEQVAQAGKIMMAFGVDADVAVKATSQLGIVAAATGGDINLLARNLGQIAAQGQAYTRDLTQFAIQGIPIWQEMSKVTGASVKELKEMAREGKISFDIVEEALNNLTAAGSNFGEIAERMQETFQGRFARIEASLQKLALEFVNSFNSIDKAMGGLVSGSMKLFADGIFAIAENMETILKSLSALTAATLAYLTVANFGAIVGAVKAVQVAILAVATAQNAANVATAVFAALTGNWAAIAAAVVVGGAAYVGLSAAIDKAKESSDSSTEAVRANIDAVGELSEAEVKYYQSLKGAFEEKMQQYDEEKKALEEKRTVLEREMEVLKAMKDEVKDKYDAEISAIRQSMEAERVKQEETKQYHQERLEEIRTRYDEELKLIDLSIAKLRAKTSEEQALYDFEKKQLIAKIQSGSLDQEALLRAKARLSRMEQQEKITELLAEKAKKQADKEQEITDAKREQTKALQEIKQTLSEQKQQIKELTNARDEEIRLIDETLQSTDNILDNINTTNRSVSEQVTLVSRLASSYASAKAQVDRLAQSLRNAAAAQRALNNARSRSSSSNSNNSGNNARASGGPVTGGSTYQVNELGKEAFLSAAGRLSMINAPSFGNWTAPTSGTVIPAHLTKQLDVPTGGVNLNSAANSNASRVSGGGIGSMISAIKGAMGGGDTFNQNVTVQSSNPTQTANNMMVEMTRLRRRRFG